jgi:hypothetical protein
MVDLHSANYEMDPGVTRGINLLAERFRLKIQSPSNLRKRDGTPMCIRDSLACVCVCVCVCARRQCIHAHMRRIGFPI